MSIIHVQRQCWQRWPRVLIAEKRNDDGTMEERRYVPEGGTENEWKARCRDIMTICGEKDREIERRARLQEAAYREAERRRAEVDGLEWAVQERDEIIRELGKLLPCASNAFRAEMERRIDELGMPS